MFQQPWLETVLLIALVAYGAGSIGSYADDGQPLNLPLDGTAVIAGLLLGVVVVVRLAWSARRDAVGSEWIVWGRMAPAIALGASVLFGLALIPFHDAINGTDTPTMQFIGNAAISVVTVLVGTLMASAAVHGTMFRWRYGRDAGDAVVHRQPTDWMRRTWRAVGLGIACIGATGWALIPLYGWQDGGFDYILGMGPAGAALLGVGLLVWFLADRVQAAKGFRVVDAERGAPPGTS